VSVKKKIWKNGKLCRQFREDYAQPGSWPFITATLERHFHAVRVGNRLLGGRRASHIPNPAESF
jgi:hypothetical protein